MFQLQRTGKIIYTGIEVELDFGCRMDLIRANKQQ